MPGKEAIRKCPGFGVPCIKEECELYADMARERVGMQEKLSMCTFTAIVLLLSDISNKLKQLKGSGLILP